MISKFRRIPVPATWQCRYEGLESTAITPPKNAEHNVKRIIKLAKKKKHKVLITNEIIKE